MANYLTVRNFNVLHTVWNLINQEKTLHQNSKTMSHADKLPKADEIIKNHIGFSMGAALMPFPGADLLAVSAVQLNMLRQLAKLYNVGFVDTLGRNLISAIVGSSLARLAASLVKAIPGVGSVVGGLSMPALSGASTYALGHVVANHFQQGGTLQDLDLTSAKKEFSEEIDNGKKVVETIKPEQPVLQNDSEEAIEKIRRLADLRDQGIITAEEFQRLKDRLLEQI